MSDLNPNSANEAQVAVRQPPSGGCFTLAELQEIATALKITLPINAPVAAMVVSAETNNLASLDATNAVFVPAISVFARTLTLAAASGVGPLIFTGWGSNIDATTAFLEVMLFVDPTEPGVETATSSGVFLRPSWEITERIASEIKIKVYHATKACSVSIRLAQVPIPPAQS